jgi:Domain of unknown function (DUF4349)
MRTDIQFLHELRDDLMQAAERRTPERVGTTLSFKRPGRTWKAVAGIAAAVVTISGVVGYVATRPSGVATTAGTHALASPAPGGYQRFSIRGPGDQVRKEADSGGNAASGGAVPRSHPPAGPPRDSGLVPDIREGRTVPSAESSIIKTARLLLRIPKDTFKARFDEATRTAETYDGYVQSSSTSGTRLRSGGLLIRIPAANFERALTDLRGLGRVEHQSVQGRDVSAQFVDLEARLRNGRAEEQVLLKLLAKAPTVEASLRVQNELSDTELQIEELQGQIRFLQHRAALSTIDVELSERTSKQETPPSHQTFGGAWHDAVDGFFGVTTTVVVGFGYVIPVALLLGAAWLIFRRLRARVIA